LHPGALYLLGAVYLTGDCVKKDIASALWCFHRASEKVIRNKIYQLIKFQPLVFDKMLAAGSVFSLTVVFFMLLSHLSGQLDFKFNIYWNSDVI